MALKVLLRRTIEGVGTVGEVVKVKPGYARNFLFPKAYAALVSPDSLRQIEKDKAAEAVRERENVARRQALVEQLKDVTVTIATEPTVTINVAEVAADAPVPATLAVTIDDGFATPPLAGQRVQRAAAALR